MPLRFRSRAVVKIPNLDLTKELQDIAKNIIVKDIQGGINRSVGIDNVSFPALEPGTIKAKKRKGRPEGGAKPLVDTGTLRRSFETDKVSRNRVQVSINPDRDKIGAILQNEGVGAKKKKFNFFGISQRAEFQAISKLRSIIKKRLNAVN